ncbi:MAG: ChbG/HpnK family deacetylase [Planctomycetota bacterium]
MRVIINADDFGLSDETVDATIECFERGGLTSATIMVNMPASERAMEHARAQQGPDAGFGVHLTYVREGDETVERPVSPPESIASLMDTDGRFLVSPTTRKRGLVGKVVPDEIAIESSAQISRLRDAGVRVTHVDSHGHLHKFPSFQRGLESAIGEQRLPVRAVQDVYLSRPRKSPGYWLSKLWAPSLRRRFTTTDHMYMPTTTWDEDWVEPIMRWMRRRPETETIEVGVHPGRGEAWRRKEFEQAIRFADACRERGHTLASFAVLAG